MLPGRCWDAGKLCCFVSGVALVGSWAGGVGFTTLSGGAMATAFGDALRGIGGLGGGLTGVVASCDLGGGNATVNPALPAPWPPATATVPGGLLLAVLTEPR